MSTDTDPGPRLPALTEAGVTVWLDQTRRSMMEGRDLETPRSHGPPAQRVDIDGEPAQAIRALTERITAILQES